jgi:Xaa-Pro aminopeptidase
VSASRAAVVTVSEAETKLRAIRGALSASDLAAVRLRGTDWFSWMTAGGSSAVLLTAETGPAEAFVTADGAWILTDAIEHARLLEEEIPRELPVWSRPWDAPEQTEQFVADHTRGGRVASDRPVGHEVALPADLVAAKRRLLPAELERYWQLGRDAAEAMTETLMAAQPEWTEQRLAGEGARALWARGIHPALTLVAGESRVTRFRHAVPTAAPLGAMAMLVFCGRRHGLYADLTRFVYFRSPSAEERRRHEAVAGVEAAAFAASRPGTPLSAVYRALADAYAVHGFAGELTRHHQGGTTGYLAREALATPTELTTIERLTALAWNPSVPGAKVEDTVVCTGDDVDVLTVDPSWPVRVHAERPRPDLLVKR